MLSLLVFGQIFPGNYVSDTQLLPKKVQEQRWKRLIKFNVSIMFKFV